ncbi:splicing factor 3b [Pseudozyma hubeiensis SY62]|uniref:Splicing factor 3b n=1 Tax=Pseudozyma hubeiensis (strain SY62) TaxID=1305764 RepID=R9P653_PSEHS|nr:splicing factor 3b [Pseudozyma hubeiensis SY62]GAC93595.1 splicing factor 3b [Pseudozyma hubeiensis SY62]
MRNTAERSFRLRIMTDIDTDLRTIVVSEDQKQFTDLGIKQLCFGQKVIGADGKPKVNLIWRSDHKAPTMAISWRVKYGLNWTKTEPTVGLVVTEGGHWKDCHLGSNYNLNKDGYFDIAPGGTPNEISILDNAHEPVYPILGLWDEKSKQYRPAYVDPTTLDTHGNAQYQPQSENETWFAARVQTSEMISSTGTAVAKFNTGIINPNTNDYLWNTTYEPLSGVWSGDNEPSASTAEVGDAFARFIVRFNKSVPVNKWIKASADVKIDLEKKWGTPVTVNWLTKFLVEIKFKSKDGMEVPRNTPTEVDIRAAFKAASQSGDFAPDDSIEIAELE